MIFKDPFQLQPFHDSMKYVSLRCIITKCSYLHLVMKNNVGVERAINLGKAEASFKPTLFVRSWIPRHDEMLHSLSQGTMLIQCSESS